MPRKLTKEQFVERSNKAHNNFYTYPGTYIDNRTKIEIICPVHGQFFATPGHHMNGHGCKKCAGNEKLTHEEFVDKANKVHNGFYKYPEEYKGATTKIDMLCPDHGIFQMIPNSHLNGHKCHKCSNVYRRTHEEFVEECNKIHNNKFKYPEKFKAVSKKIAIECPIHGIFYQLASDHLDGLGCAACAGLKRKTTEEFILDAQKVHGDFYNYEYVEYINANTPVKIECPEHGIYIVTPVSHLEHDCPKCSKSYSRNQEEYIKECSEVHNNFYNYSLVNFIDNNNKVKIICPEHGEFEQLFSLHLYGQGCPKCSKNYKHTKETFIEKAISVHGDLYSYELVNFINLKTEVEIICKKHGSFIQKPSNHLAGCGCQICRLSRGEVTILNYLKSNNIKYKPQYTYDDCRKILPLPFDFAVLNEDNSVKYLIEFQGKQHYFPYDFSGRLSKEETESKFLELCNRDKIKKEYCEKNSIPLLCISYNDIKDIPKLIKDLSDKLNF